MDPVSELLPARFWSKVSLDGATSCWVWTSVVDSWGYGQYKHDGTMKGAHRVAYTVLVGPVPDGLELDHVCRRPACVNPDHLEPVTHSENVRRGTSFVAEHATKTHCKNGHPFDDTNTYVPPGGDRRSCRACNREEARRYRQKKAQMIIHSLTAPRGPRCGDIGEDPREIEFEPLTQPATEPVTVPATPAPVQEPAKEPVPA